jgi:hypothetical protein
MSADELHRFIEVDGHVGLEEEQEHAARFERFFSHVAWEPRYALCLGSEEFLKQADKYGLNFEDDFLEYLRGLSFKERRAFDLAMGYVFAKVSELNIHLPKSGLYVFVKASDEALGPFYNEHRDRHALFSSHRNLSSPQDLVVEKIECLDRNPLVSFDDGWFEPNTLPPIARWMGSRGRIKFSAASISEISFDITTHIPELRAHPLGIEVFLNGVRLCAFSFWRYGWLELSVAVPEALSSQGEFELELRADHTWQPRPVADETRDDRELSVAVCNIVVQP